jgi:hypothetical protein
MPCGRHAAGRFVLFSRRRESNIFRVVSCGGRKEAHDDFCTALCSASEDERVMLLVDSEGLVGAAPNKGDLHLATPLLSINYN